MNSDTIVAIATPPGRGGVGIVRLSGPKAYFIAKTLTQSVFFKPRVATLTSFFDADAQLLDKGLVIYFKAPHSFTGEDVIEFQAHGSPIVLDELVKACTAQGARVARAGEFSERAFLNDKIDLTQAEAVSDLIDASSKAAARMAVRSLEGAFSDEIKALNEALIHLRLYVEAAIDFPEEEIDFLNDGHIAQNLKKIIDTLKSILNTASQGALLREGFTLVIAGPPNAGKSTLINALSKKDVAIVTHIPGTTRDVMKEEILIDDLPIHIVDTAGLRETDDIVEKEGIKRAYGEVEKADCILLMEDATDLTQKDLAMALKKTFPTAIPLIHVKNKIDALKLTPHAEKDEIFLSAQSGEGLSLLKEKIKQMAGFKPSEGMFLARRRHLDALNQALSLLIQGQSQLTEHRAGELLAEDLRQAHMYLCEITGEFHSDDLLGVIFSSFCIGK